MTNQTTSNPNVPATGSINSQKSKKMGYHTATISKKIFLAERETTLLSTNPTTKKIMQPFGYSDEKIANFVKAYQETAEAQLRQSKEMGEKVGAYAEFEKLFTEAKTQMHYLSKVAKLALRDNEHALKTLRLNENKKEYRTINGMLGFMNNFYQNALRDSAICETLSKYNYPRETLQAYLNNQVLCNETYTKLSKESADAIEATRVRDNKLAILDDFMFEYYGFLKIAYELNPGWLEEQQMEEMTAGGR